jgi:NAD(P)-dependent dehydrogenase (short-subunit alcohol dehydrogenase family)
MPAPYNTNTTATELVSDYAPLIKGKTILATGVTPGTLGGFYVQSIAAAKPANLILAGRNSTKLSQCANEITAEHPEVNVRTLQVDLSSLKSARNAANQVNSWDDIPVIDVLVNNAGIMAVDYKLSEDGVESQFATNHLGPFLFTNLVIRKVLRSTAPRVVMVTSDGHRLSPVRLHDYNFDVSCSLMRGCGNCVLKVVSGGQDVQ